MGTKLTTQGRHSGPQRAVGRDMHTENVGQMEGGRDSKLTMEGKPAGAGS